MLACQLISKCQGLFEVPAILLPHRLAQVWNNRDFPVAQRESQVYRKTGERNSFSCECEEFRMSTSICMGIFVQQQWKFL